MAMLYQNRNKINRYLFLVSILVVITSCAYIYKGNITSMQLAYYEYGGYAATRKKVRYILRDSLFVNSTYNDIRKTSIDSLIYLLNKKSTIKPQYKRVTLNEYDEYKSILKRYSPDEISGTYWTQDLDTELRYRLIEQKYSDFPTSSTIITKLATTHGSNSFLYDNFLPMRLALYSNVRDSIIIEPFLPYEGSPWIIRYNKTKQVRYINSEVMTDFISRIGFEDYLPFSYIFHYILHIETNRLNGLKSDKQR